MSSTTLRSASLAGQVYAAVRATGPLGARFAALADEFPDRTTKAVENTLWRLKVAGFIAYQRTAQAYLVDDTCKAPVLREPSAPRGRLLSLIGDCGAGISAKVLYSEARMTETQVARHLGRDLACGHVRRIEMPDTHGGGSGYVLDHAVKPAAEAPKPTPTKAPVQTLAGAASRAAPAVAVGVDGRGNFRLLPTGQFVIGWGESFEVMLPRDVTRAMFRYLDQLGGLNIDARLPAAEGGAA